ncbi:predicted protein [Botrytis cinerea T4]|uniref:Uncharacterized protein n=1 Tax=Botryotinia fuckeliana (strain T4) TaxID=999810 RepID=G2XVD6_BOTF4|nr:predicted protein [Botrytis cinerea T4]
MTTVKKRDVGKDLQFPRSKRRAGAHIPAAEEKETYYVIMKMKHRL